MTAPSTQAAWARLWREAPADVRRDFLRLSFMTPGLLWAFALLWGLLP